MVIRVAATVPQNFFICEPGERIAPVGELIVFQVRTIEGFWNSQLSCSGRVSVPEQ
jgi:hypothetical protein